MERRTLLTIFVLAVLAIAAQVLVWVLRPHDNANEFVGPPRVKTYTISKSANVKMIENSMTTERIGLIKGRVTCRKRLMDPAPSTLAAS